MRWLAWLTLGHLPAWLEVRDPQVGLFGVPGFAVLPCPSITRSGATVETLAGRGRTAPVVPVYFE